MKHRFFQGDFAAPAASDFLNDEKVTNGPGHLPPWRGKACGRPQGSPLRRKPDCKRWLGKARRRSGTAPVPIFLLLRPPVGPGGTAPKHSWFCAPEGFCQLQGVTLVNRGPGKGDYEHEVLIWSRSRGRFAYFAAMGKVGRRPQAAKLPAQKINTAPRKSPDTARRAKTARCR